MGQSLRERIKQGLNEATKSQDKTRTATLRLIVAAIKDRDIAGRTDGRDGGVGEGEIMEVLSKMIKQRRESADTYEQAGRMELAEQERAEIAVIEEFLPKQMDESEIQSAVDSVVSELGAEGLKDMGRVMGELKGRYAGQMDFSKAGPMVKARLG